MGDSERVRKLKWLCRRGMKELDILLERFIDNHQESLADGSWPDFEDLLQTEDDVLWDWFQDSSNPTASRYQDLLDQICRGSD
jgi:antitoxin CptB